MKTITGSLRCHCIDWDGTQIADNEPPIDGVTCGELRKAADRIEELERESRINSGSVGMARTDWAYVCGRLAAATGSEPKMYTMPAGFQGTYCRGYDAEKGWDEGTTIKMVEGAAQSP